VVVVEAMDLPPDASEFHEKVRAALEKAVGQRELELVKPTSNANCASAACLKSLAATSGATEILAVTGGQTEFRGYKLDVELWHAAAGTSEYGSAECNFCNGPQMVAAAEKQAGPMLDHLVAVATRAPPPAAVPVAPPPSAPTLVSQPSAERSTGRMALGGSLVAVGAATAVLGVVFLYQDGKHTDCETVCRSIYDARGLGIPLVAGGLALSGVGGWLLFTGHGTTVAVGSRGASIAGSF
jgi:hypothetical protein